MLRVLKLSWRVLRELITVPCAHEWMRLLSACPSTHSPKVADPCVALSHFQNSTQVSLRTIAEALVKTAKTSDSLLLILVSEQTLFGLSGESEDKVN